MGCINSTGDFAHWFGNIHLSGRCNRSCYFCIGQHMMALDPLDVLDVFPLPGLDGFVASCMEHGVSEVNVTGTNTDPLLYRHVAELREALESGIPGLVLGIRTNGALSAARKDVLRLFDKGSLTVCSFDPLIYKAMMGSGIPPDLGEILPFYDHFSDLKLNVVLGDENVRGWDFLDTVLVASNHGIKRINLREPYGQSHIGDPLAALGLSPVRMNLGMPVYDVHGASVCYWDVHYVEVESVNLYANGVVSTTYPITRGHDPVSGAVIPQSEWGKGRHFEQWRY